MIYTHTIGRIGKDCQTITGTHGTFMTVDIAVDDYSKGQNITTWVRVRSNRENHVRLVSINADSIAFVNAGKREEQSTDPKKAAKKGAKAKSTPQPPTDAPTPDEKDLPF